MKKECEQFKLDLTDYAGGDISQIADMKAFEKHLKTCADCRTELNKLRKTLGVLVAGESHSERLQKKISVLKQQIIRKDTYDLKRLIQANKIKEAISLIVKQYIIKNHTEKLSLFERTFDGIYENIKAQGMSHIEDRQKITGLSKEAAFIPHGQTPTLLGSIIAEIIYPFFIILSFYFKNW